MTVADEETYVSKHVIKTMNISTVIVILVIVVCSKKKAIPDKMRVPKNLTYQIASKSDQ